MIERWHPIRFKPDRSNLGRRRSLGRRHSMIADQASSLVSIASLPTAPVSCGHASGAAQGMVGGKASPPAPVLGYSVSQAVRRVAGISALDGAKKFQIRPFTMKHLRDWRITSANCANCDNPRKQRVRRRRPGNSSVLSMPQWWKIRSVVADSTVFAQSDE
jgi:hypothetical protein